jgi:hypothetical protein
VSRKWERMVEKNRKVVNKQRVKGGKSKLSYDRQPEKDTFRGRSIFLPIFFMSISIMFVLFFGQAAGQQDMLYWVTVISYFVLSLYFFFLKRPYLKVGKAQISTRKLGREKIINALDVEKITIQPGYIIISIKGKRSQMVFSRLFNRYDLKAMGASLKEFAHNQSISYEVEN